MFREYNVRYTRSQITFTKLRSLDSTTTEAWSMSFTVTIWIWRGLSDGTPDNKCPTLVVHPFQMLPARRWRRQKVAVQQTSHKKLKPLALSLSVTKLIHSCKLSKHTHSILKAWCTPWQGDTQRSKGSGQLSMPDLFFPNLPFSHVILSLMQNSWRPGTKPGVNIHWTFYLEGNIRSGEENSPIMLLSHGKIKWPSWWYIWNSTPLAWISPPSPVSSLCLLPLPSLHTLVPSSAPWSSFSIYSQPPRWAHVGPLIPETDFDSKVPQDNETTLKLSG